MANYNQQKVLSELGKLDPEELHKEYLVIKDFVSKVLIAEQEKIEQRSSELQSKIEKL